MHNLNCATVCSIVLLLDPQPDRYMCRYAAAFFCGNADLPAHKLLGMDYRKAPFAFIYKFKKKVGITEGTALGDLNLPQPKEIVARTLRYPLLIVLIGVLFGISDAEKFDGGPVCLPLLQHRQKLKPAF